MLLNDETRGPWRDFIVEETREAGRQIEARAGGGVQGFFAYLRRAQEKYRNRLVTKIERPRATTAPGGTDGDSGGR